MRKQKYKMLLIAAIAFIFSSCNHKNTVYNQYKELPEKGWNKDSAAHFEVSLEKGIGYKMLVNVRNRGEFKTQNLWLFISYERPDKSIKKDTIELYLADNQGRWLGSGFGSLYEMPVEFVPNIKLSQTGVYKFDIKQGMRDTMLIGINDIGLEILKND